MKKMIKYTEDQLAYLEHGYKSMNVRDLTKAFNDHFDQERTEEAIKSKLIKYGISCGRAPKDRLVNRIRLFTEVQKMFIKENYKGRSVAEMTRFFNDYFKTNIAEKQITAFVQNNGITSGRTGRFKKKHVPWNYNTKGFTGPNKRSFKKGSIPPKTKPLGSERTGKDDYRLIKVLDRNGRACKRFKPKHVHIWEKVNGPVPAGHVIAFKDSNKNNMDISNLVLLSRAEMLRLNQRKYSDRTLEVRESLIALTKLEIKVAKLRCRR